MRDLTRNIRFWILLAASVLAIGIGIHYGLGTEFPNYGKLVRTFALLAVGTLYLTLLITPLYDCFPKLPYRGLVVKARRAMGVSVVMFSTLHLYFAFYKQLGGWVGLPYLEQRYVVAITVAAIASCILWLMALTSFDSMVRKLGPLWKRLHRLVYTAGFLIIFHALSIGTHFVDLRSAPARIMLLLVFALFVLEALRLDRRVRPKGTRIGIFTLGTVAVTGYTLAAYAGTPVNGVSVHTQHSANTFVMPGMQKNDMSTRYTVNIVSNPVKPVPGQPVAMTITFYNAITGQKVSKFTQAYEKFLHMVVVNNGLTSFEHLHPATTAEGSFELTHTFKEEGTYRMYFNFHPFQAPEQIVGQTVV
ncbi:MAG: ferric reductase-like transmembrane domain-containing protein, partial [Candidatus Paceibacterota bacterium]